MAKRHPKNVQAIFDWYKQFRPDMLATIERLFPLDRRPSSVEDMMAGLLLQGFEAGREFEKAHPEVVSGIGYLSDPK